MTYACQVSNYPNCCGIIVLYNFHKNPEPISKLNLESFWGRKVSQEELDLYNKQKGVETTDQWKERVQKWLENQVRQTKGRRSQFLATINKAEYPLKEAFLNAGFEVLIPETFNPNSSGEIMTFVYYLTPTNEQKAKKPIEKVKSVLKKIA